MKKKQSARNACQTVLNIDISHEADVDKEHPVVLMAHDCIDRKLQAWHAQHAEQTRVSLNVRSPEGIVRQLGKSQLTKARKPKDSKPGDACGKIELMISKQPMPDPHTQTSVSGELDLDTHFLLTMVPQFESTIGDFVAPKERSFGPKPENDASSLCDECTQETVSVIEDLDRILREQLEEFDARAKKRYQRHILWIAVLTLIATVASVLATLYSARSPQPKLALTEPDLVAVGLTIETELIDFPTMSEPFGKDSTAPRVGQTMHLALGSIPDNQVVFVLGIENDSILIRPKLAKEWHITSAGMNTILALTIELNDDSTEADMAALLESLQSSTSARVQLPAPLLWEYFRYEWTGQGFEAVVGAGDRGFSTESNEEQFHDWATGLEQTIKSTLEQAGYAKWAWSGRSFLAKEAE